MTELFKYGWNVVKSTATIDDDLLKHAINGDYLEIVKNIHTLLRPPPAYHHIMHVSFTGVCRRGNLRMAQWILSVNTNIRMTFCRNLAFNNACKMGHLEVAQWMYAVSIKQGNKIDVTLDAGHGVSAFSEACDGGHLEVAQWIYSISNDVDMDEGLTNACASGHLNVVEWIISINGKLNMAFFEACFYGKLNLAQCIYSKRRNSINITDAFRGACENGHLDVAQWLSSLSPHMYVILSYHDHKVQYRIVSIVSFGLSFPERLECPICYENECNVMETTCKHSFCIRCISKWLNQDGKCPLCRATIHSFASSLKIIPFKSKF